LSRFYYCQSSVTLSKYYTITITVLFRDLYYYQCRLQALPVLCVCFVERSTFWLNCLLAQHATIPFWSFIFPSVVAVWLLPVTYPSCPSRASSSRATSPTHLVLCAILFSCRCEYILSVQYLLNSCPSCRGGVCLSCRKRGEKACPFCRAHSYFEFFFIIRPTH
jgi:hypothetical protein